MEYTNIKSKTIFYFCNDERIINEVIIVPKALYLEEIKKNPLVNARVLIEYAERVGNKRLLEAVLDAYKTELEQANNE